MATRQRSGTDFLLLAQCTGKLSHLATVCEQYRAVRWVRGLFSNIIFSTCEIQANTQMHNNFPFVLCSRRSRTTVFGLRASNIIQPSCAFYNCCALLCLHGVRKCRQEIKILNLIPRYSGKKCAKRPSRGMSKFRMLFAILQKKFPLQNLTPCATAYFLSVTAVKVCL